MTPTDQAHRSPVNELESALHRGTVTPEVCAAALREIQGNLHQRRQFLSEPGSIAEEIQDLGAIADDLLSGTVDSVQAVRDLELLQQDLAQKLHPAQTSVLDPEQHQITYVIAALRTMPAAAPHAKAEDAKKVKVKKAEDAAGDDAAPPEVD